MLPSERNILKAIYDVNVAALSEGIGRDTALIVL
jgi:hypothetical protein